MGAISDLMRYYETKLQEKVFDSLGGIQLASGNVMIGDTMYLNSLNETQFPRVEYTIWKRQGLGRIGTNAEKVRLTFQMAGYILTDTPDLTSEKFFTTNDYGEELKAVVKFANVDRALGNFPCPGFLHVEDNLTLYVTNEIDGKIMVTVVEYNIVITEE